MSLDVEPCLLAMCDQSAARPAASCARKWWVLAAVARGSGATVRCMSVVVVVVVDVGVDAATTR